MLDWFDYHGHMCIAFDLLGLSVFDFLVNLLKSFVEFSWFNWNAFDPERKLLYTVHDRPVPAHDLSIVYFGEM